MFNDLLKKQYDRDYEISVTENGAVGYKTTSNPFLDFNFKLPYYRRASYTEITNDFKKLIDYDVKLALRYLFFLRDVRGGLGERRIFRLISLWLTTNSEYFRKALSLFSEYGRWDDLIALFNEGSKKTDVQIINIIKKQLDNDTIAAKENKPISLLAKWMPSVQGSNRKKALSLTKALDFSEKQYRKRLSFLRKHLKVVEVTMSDRKWEEINYEAVPSKANVKYNAAFLRHDESRRKNFLEAVSRGEAKINSAVNYPHDIVGKYLNLCGWATDLKDYDEGLEALWKALPGFDGGENVLTVADTSGSMCCFAGNPLKVCYGLTIYFAERAKGQFHNKAILFSSKPSYIDFDQAGKSLHSKLSLLRKYNDCSNTNIEATFDLVLNTAINNNLKQEDLPKTILVISDMEFDEAIDDFSYNFKKEKLFDIIRKKYENNGYQMPKLVFWNVASRTNTIPVVENPNGYALVSGFSTNIVKMVLSNRLDAFEILKEQIMDSRYDIVEKTIFN